jgi:pseudouridine-5'-monophosphatase
MSHGSRSIIFDLDGTLLDSEGLYTEAATRVCARYGATYTLELKRRVMGGDTLRGAGVVVSALGLPLSPEAYMAERELELMLLLPTCQAIAGAEALVETLFERGVPMAIATSGHRAITTFKLAHQPVLSRITTVVCGDDPRLLHPKPAPDIFLLAAHELGARAERCVVFEDSLNGVRAGVAAGMRTVALVDLHLGFSPSQFTGAAHVVHSLLDLTLDELLAD